MCRERNERHLSRRCSGVNPSSLACFDLWPILAWALSRSRSLWFPRSLFVKIQLTQYPEKKEKKKSEETGKLRLVAEKRQGEGFLKLLFNFLGIQTEGKMKIHQIAKKKQEIKGYDSLLILEFEIRSNSSIQERLF